MRTRFIIASIVVLFAIAGIIAVRFLNPLDVPSVQEPLSAAEGKYVVTQTAKGYEPATLTIPHGETVTFKSMNGKPHWPASNLHPSHLLYAEFDPLMPVKAGASWSFTFNKPGTWQYHDHLAPYYTGTVIVEPAL